MLQSEPEAAARLLEACYDQVPDLGRITMPTAIIHGASDRIVPAEEAYALHAAIPDSSLHVLDGIGHVPTLTAAAAVVSVIEQRFGT